MEFQQIFNARQVEPASFLPPPPLADYHVRIVDSEAKPTKDNSGGYVNFQLEILDPGPHQARKVPYNLNLFHTNPQTVEIAYRQLSALCHVTGVFDVKDTRQLHNIPFIATIGPQPNNPQYSNVFGVKDINGNAPGKGNAPAVPSAPPPTAAAPPAWGAPPAQPAAPTWPGAAPAPAPAQPAAPAWGPPPQAAPTAAPTNQPPWAPAGGQPSAPPWAR